MRHRQAGVRVSARTASDNPGLRCVRVNSKRRPRRHLETLPNSKPDPRGVLPSDYSVAAVLLFHDTRSCVGKLSISEFLHHLRSPQIMQVNDAFQFAPVVNDYQRRNLLLLHHGQCRRGKLLPGNRPWILRHALAGS